LRPTAGQAFIFGRDCQKEGLEARANIGYLPGELGIYSDLTGSEVLHLLAGLGRRRVDEKRRHELQDRLEMPARDLRRRLREYSTGMKRKLGLIQAFQGDPHLLVLDEPTEGLDPLMQEVFYELLAEAKQRGGTVFMSSHVLSEVGRVCDRVALLRKGELVLLAGVDDSRKLAARRVRVLFDNDVGLPANLPDGAEMVKAGSRTWDLAVASDLGPLLRALAPLPVRDLEIEEPSLEDVVMKYYRGGAS
jgi:ABC-2 type transport system ATP-binding protein